VTLVGSAIRLSSASTSERQTPLRLSLGPVTLIGGATRSGPASRDLCVPADLVFFRSTFVQEADGATRTSDFILRFRRREEAADSLRSAGFVVGDLRRSA
jgi:hypothetical protein